MRTSILISSFAPICNLFDLYRSVEFTFQSFTCELLIPIEYGREMRELTKKKIPGELSFFPFS